MDATEIDKPVSPKSKRAIENSANNDRLPNLPTPGETLGAKKEKKD